MKNLIKAQLFQISKMRVLRLVALGAAGLSVLMGLVDYMNGEDALDEGQLLTASDFCTRAGHTITFIILFMSIFTAFICADDFGDKTSNYEILSGRLRWQSYFARAILSVTLSTLFGILMLVVSVVTYTLACGWGNSITVSDALFRLALIALPLFRLNCFFVLAAFIFKKTFIVPVAAFAMQTLISIVQGASSSHVTDLTSLGTLNKLFKFDTWYIFGMESKARMYYETALESSTVAMAVLASVFFGALYLAIGCSLYHRDDLD